MNDQNTYNENEGRGPQETKTQTEGYYQTNQNQNQTGVPFDPMPPKDSNTFSVLALVMGILSVVGICCCGGSLLFGAAAIVFAMISRTRAGFFDGKALAGLIMGIIGAALGVIGVMITALSVANLNNPSIRDILDDAIFYLD